MPFPKSIVSLVLLLGFAWQGFSQNPVVKTYGIDFSPYEAGQNPNLGSQITTEQVLARMQVVAPYTSWIRSFGSTNGLENIPSVARQMGLKVAANAWISSDLTQNQQEINNLIANANAGLVDVAIVGSEAILRGDVSVARLISYINQVRQAIPSGIPVATADVWGTFVSNPDLIAATDLVLANFYPYWEGASITNAMCSLDQEYQQLVQASASKTVVVSETGWPSAGNAVGAAVPSVTNANTFALQFLTWAKANNIQSFYFEAFDEAWKVSSEGPQGAAWGIWDENALIKTGMDAFFNGLTSVDGQPASVNCNSALPGAPGIAPVYIPPYGSADAMEVQVAGVQPANYAIATYIDVAGGWWTKPTYAQPTVWINPDGTARIAIETGGIDYEATEIEAFLIPAGGSPPPADGGSKPAPPTGTVASFDVTRTQSSISGTVADSEGHPISGATITDPVLGSATSGPDGNYSFYNITTSGTATLSVTYPNYVFPASPTTVAIPTGNQVVNFSGTAAVDLSVISSVPSGPISPGWTIIETILASNAGPAAATDALVTLSIPTSLTSVSVSTTRGSCNLVDQPVTCDLGSMARTAYATLTVSGTVGDLGSYTLGANVSGPDPDSNPTNNMAIQTFTAAPILASRFVPVSPCRLVDTRNMAGPLGGPFVAGSESRNFPIPSSINCGIPGTAEAYSLNLTVAPHGTLGYVTLWPTGQRQPLVSTLNSIDGRIKANASIVPAGTGGAVAVYATNDTDVILDINGYFVPETEPGAQAFYPMAPCRVVDTRPDAPSSSASTGALIGGTSRTLPILSSSCNVPPTAAAYSLNFTVVPQNGTLGYLTVYPTGVSRPLVSTLNDLTGTVVANAAIVPAGIGGNIDVYATDTTQLVVDIDGYFAPPGAGGLSFYPAPPCRVLDSRNPPGALPFTGTINVDVIGSGCTGVSAAPAYVFNATVAPPGALGYLTLWAAGGGAQPLVSTLNALDGSITSNMAIVPASNSAVSAFASDSTFLILDASGYFAP